MARGRTTIEHTEAKAEAATDAPIDTGFGAEFRELARQRRFVRDADAESAPSVPEPKAKPKPDWRDAAAPAKRKSRTERAVAAPAPSPATKPSLGATRTPRLSDDQRAIVSELARMSDQLVDAREQLVVATTRTTHLEASLAERATQLRDANDRVMASRLLVQDAQQATHDMAERCAWLEARCDALQQALEMAVNASWLTRLRWRREQRAAARS